MIFVAVKGPVGSGKSTVLQTVGDRLLKRGHHVDGFTQVAESRDMENRGAKQYQMKLIPSGEQLVWANRTEGEDKPYRVVEANQKALADRFINLESSLEIVILDEFGRMEMNGEGHLAIWNVIHASDPIAVLIGVRDKYVDALADALGITWDVIVDARDRRIVDHLVSLCDHSRDWEQVGLYGAASGAVEVSLGTALHAATIPAAGIIMSGLQAIVMTAAAEGLDKRHRVAWVALVAAGLKALSPAGSRLRPMLAISVQGSLFATALRFIKWGPLSVAVGGALVGAWAAAQSVLLQWLLVGNDMGKAYDIVVKWIASLLGLGSFSFLAAMSVFVAFSSLVTGIVTLVFWKSRNQVIHRLHEATTRIRSKKRSGKRSHALSEFLRPSFWLPITMIAAILFVHGSNWEHIGWIVLRSLAVGFLLFGCIKLVPIRKLPTWLQKIGLLGPATAVSRAFRRL